MRLLLIFCITTISISLSAQMYVPIDTADVKKRNEFVELYQKADKEFINNIKSKYQGKTAKLLIKQLNEFSEAFISHIKGGQFCFDKRFYDKANEVFNEIKTNNPNFNLPTQILISKDLSLNAFCLPNGAFVINMGTFYWLQNENQLAGILSHEMGHLYLNHIISNLYNVIESEKSENNKVEAIKKSKYNRQEKALELYKNQIYLKSAQRKKNEFEADSMGVVFLKNTKYYPHDFIQMMKLVGEYDSLKPNIIDTLIYKQLFDLPNQPFSPDWLKIEDFSAYNYSLYKERFNKDSIATHPEMKLRIDKLEILYPELKNSIASKPTPQFDSLRIIADYEQVPNLCFYEQYGLGIFLCMQQIQEGKNTEYYKKMLGICFEKVYEARKKYQLNRYLDAIDPKNQSTAYQLFLSFMWNLKLEEIKNIKDYYLEKYK